jgi:hypothetical protein
MRKQRRTSVSMDLLCSPCFLCVRRFVSRSDIRRGAGTRAPITDPERSSGTLPVTARRSDGTVAMATIRPGSATTRWRAAHLLAGGGDRGGEPMEQNRRVGTYYYKNRRGRSRFATLDATGRASRTVDSSCGELIGQGRGTDIASPAPAFFPVPVFSLFPFSHRVFRCRPPAGGGTPRESRRRRPSLVSMPHRSSPALSIESVSRHVAYKCSRKWRSLLVYASTCHVESPR